jgi:predicted cupin superfamily sugar epimerase
MDVKKLIIDLDLQPLPGEGGYYRETYRSKQTIDLSGRAKAPHREKQLSTAIYYLLTADTFSALHRLSSDEIFHFYRGDPVTMLQLLPDGEARVMVLGQDIEKGQLPQCLVSAGVWQGCCLEESGEYALLGVTVSPGFDFTDLELASRSDLLASYPGQVPLIERLTAPASDNRSKER